VIPSLLSLPLFSDLGLLGLKGWGRDIDIGLRDIGLRDIGLSFSDLALLRLKSWDRDIDSLSLCKSFDDAARALEEHGRQRRAHRLTTTRARAQGALQGCRFSVVARYEDKWRTLDLQSYFD